MQVRSLCQEDPLEEGMATHSVFLPGGSNGQRRLVGYIHRVAELDTTEVAQCTPHTHTHTHTHMFSSLSRGAALALTPGHMSPSAGDIFKASARPRISDSGTLA